MSSNKAAFLPESEPWRVRPYRPQDFPALCALDRLCFPEGISYTPEDIAVALAQRGAFALVAEAQDRVVAFVLAYQKKRPLGHIVTIDVHPDFRRQRLGSRLIESAERFLRQSGAVRVILEVATENEAAQRFYEGRGYFRIRLLPRYYSDGSNAYLMEKNLP